MSYILLVLLVLGQLEKIENTGKWENNNIWYTLKELPEFKDRDMGTGINCENLYINIFRRRK
ncbi:MAG: hypothetical protein DRI52_11910 [Chloroflexi bacterium]|nr:MAG: hypothetical protein DRI52_11910 [Chloroflexota bacterium]